MTTFFQKGKNEEKALGPETMLLLVKKGRRIRVRRLQVSLSGKDFGVIAKMRSKDSEQDFPEPKKVLIGLAVVACLTGIVVAVEQSKAGTTTSGACSPVTTNVSGNVTNNISCPGVDERAMKAFLDYLDKKNLAYDQKVKELNELAKKYHELEARLKEIKSPRVRAGAEELLRGGDLSGASLIQVSSKSVAYIEAGMGISGAGVVISSGGYVLTSAALISHAVDPSQIMVRLGAPSAPRIHAELVSRNAGGGRVALLKIRPGDPGSLTSARRGDSSKVMPFSNLTVFAFITDAELAYFPAQLVSKSAQSSGACPWTVGARTHFTALLEESPTLGTDNILASEGSPAFATDGTVVGIVLGSAPFGGICILPEQEFRGLGTGAESSAIW